MTLAIIRDVNNWTGNEGGIKLKCKKCGIDVEIYEDWANYEFIYKTGFCRMCLIDFGYAS